MIAKSLCTCAQALSKEYFGKAGILLLSVLIPAYVGIQLREGEKNAE